ncbi:MAG: hypothetical protein SPL08_03830 [Pseudomonadota bacterium]|nr:hypothetical protein [Pseudomonadota bacterium]
MKAPILKAVSMPQKLFWAPIKPALVNIAVQMAFIVILAGAFRERLNPQIFIFTIAFVHVILIFLGIKEPHLSGVLTAWGQMRQFWDKEGNLKAGRIDTKMSPDGEGILINGHRVRVLQLSENVDFNSDWRRWLLSMARYPVTVRVWQSNRDTPKIILSSKENDTYRLREAIGDTQGLLQTLNPQELSVTETAHIWNDLLSGGIRYLKTGTLTQQNGREYRACINIQSWGDFSDSNMIRDLLTLGDGISIHHWFRALSSARVNPLLIQQRKMAYLSTFSQNVYNQYTMALEAIDAQTGTSQVAVDYALSIWVRTFTETELETVIEKVRAVLQNYGVKAIREKKMLKACFLTQFSDVVSIPRRFLMLSDNVASELSFTPYEKTFISGEF